MAHSARRVEKFRRVLEHRQPDLTVVVENVFDPHNVSAILRTCDAVGILRIELLYTVEPFPKMGKKSSSSASKWIERRKHRSVESCFGVLRREGFQILASRVGPESTSLYEMDLARPTAIVLGNEHRGVSDEAAGRADGLVGIPMMGMIESLNVSVAAAVFLYEALRQRQACGHYRTPRLAEAGLAGLLDAWLKK